MKRHGLLAAGILGSATAICLLLNRYNGLSASEEETRSFRQALEGTETSDVDDIEDGFRINYYDATWNRVLQDLAKHNELTLVMDKVPPVAARKDSRSYDVDDAIRILNTELESQGYRLLRQKQFLVVLNLDKARTEYARPRLAQEAESVDERSSSMDKLIRSASASRTIDDAVDDGQALPLLDPNVDRFEPARNSSRPISGFVTSPRTRPSRIRQTAGSDEQSRTQDDFGPPVRPVSKGGRVVSDEQSETPFESPMTVNSVELENAKAADLARTIYVVFEQRAELQKQGLDGFPTFAVYGRAEDGAANKAAPPHFRIGIDQETNRVLIEAPASRMPQLRKLVTDLDQPAAFVGDKTVKVLQNNGIKAETAKQLSEQIHQLVSMSDETVQGTNGTSPRQEATGDEDDPSINLRGEVNIQAMQDIGVLILKGNEADVEKVQEIIRRLEKISVGSLPAIHVLTLENIDSEAFATLLTSVYEQLTELRTRGGTARKAAAFIPVVQPNAILIISSEIERTSILELAKELDQPLSPDFEFQVFALKSAIASQVVTALTTFYSERPGLGTNVRAIADVRTNSVIVQGRPSELAEVKTLIEGIDKDEPGSVNRLQVIKLKNAVAEELSATISQAIQAVINPPQQTSTGQGGFGGAGGQTQGSQELRTSKSVALEFLTTTGGVRDLIRSGILADVRVNFDARSNSLLVTAPESSMNLMEALIEALDQSPGATSEIKVFTLKNADAQQSVDTLTTMFENTNQETQLGIQLAGTEGSSSSLIPLRFSPDIRTNSVLAIGSAESLSVVEAILLRLDSDDTRQRLTTVIPLRNAAADLVAATLLDYLTQQQNLQQSAAELFSNIERIRQEVLVSADLNSNSLIVSASPQYFNQINQIVEALDAQPPEVVIQALLVEVTLDSTDEFGIELGLQDPLLLARSLVTTTTGASTSVATTPGLNFNSTGPLGNNSGVGTSPGTVATQGLSNFSLGRNNADAGFGGFIFSAQSDAVSILLRALASRRTVQILSRPQVRATHNNEAYVTVGQSVPLQGGLSQTNNSTVSNVTYQQVGITLRVTPRITPDGMIAMNVFADKSSLAPTGVTTNVDIATGVVTTSPVINQSQAQTTVNVPNGQTIVIGGMITKSDGTDERKVPWLGDLPVVGRAFRYDKTRTQRTELLIFLTPRIVLSDIDSELIKQVETERLHFIESDAEELHGPLYSVPGQTNQPLWKPEEGTILTPDMKIEEMLEPDPNLP
ncbi:MAG: secretin N-terminal domain-containing protein [Planctomycetaceae bacterium]